MKFYALLLSVALAALQQGRAICAPNDRGPSPGSWRNYREGLLQDTIPGATSQERIVSGRVVDENGLPVAGVTITILGNTKGVVTDEDGRYSITVKKGDKLVVSFLGKETQTIELGEVSLLDITLRPKQDALEGVTVVAFGTQKKESVVGSITTVNPSDLKVPSSNLTTALAGRMAGLVAYQRSGEPGADNANFFIRGVTSFGYSNSPLILVDGVEMPASELARMQVDDIASFSIMKDATSTALYGARGANGVILITTKEGKEGKASVSLRVESSVSSPTREIQLADPITYMELGNEAVLTRNALGILPYSQEKIENTRAGNDPLLYPATNWHDLLFKNHAVNNRVNLNVSGGGKVARYYVAATYNKDNGVLKVDRRNNFNNNIDLKTYNLRSNVNINLTPTTEAIVRLNSTWSDYTGPIGSGTALYNEVMHTNPVLYPAYYPADASNAYTQHILFGNYDAGQFNNPYADMVKGYQDYTRSTILAQFELKQDLSFILDGLKLSGMFNTTRYSNYSVQRNYNPFYYSLGFYNKVDGSYTLNLLNPTTGTEYLNYSEGAKDISVVNYFQGILSYNHSFHDDHLVSATLVSTLTNSLAANAGTLQKSLPHRNVGLAGRTTYAYKGKYFLEANFGYNGSERFSSNNRFGFFPSIGTAWYISKEKFWQEGIKKAIPSLKLKATYGLVGNDAIGSDEDRFFFLSEVSFNDPSKSYTFGTDFGNTINGVTESRYENREITWEQAAKTNLGIEMNLFNLFNLTADVYQEHRTNILVSRVYIPSTMGLQSTPKANVGEARSKGIDLSLNFDRSFANGWFLSGRANFTYATSEFVAYEEPDYSETPWKSRIGNSLAQNWGYVADRLFVDDKEVINSPFQGSEVMGGDIKFKDINGDGQVNELDEVPIGYPTTPEIVYGFGFSAGYKQFDLSCFLQGIARESFWIDPIATAPFINNNALLQVYANSHWSEDNRDLYALWPRLSNTPNANNSRQSTWFMRDGSFLRVKSLEVGYSLPDRLMKRLKLKQTRFYANGTNLFTFSDFDLWDPEMGGNGLGYPIQRVINFGIQCSF